MANDKAEGQPARDEKAKGEAAGETLEKWGDAPATMKKAIELKVTLWIEGEDAPAHDFAKSAAEAAREIITAGSAKHPELKVTIKKIAEKHG
ncbi:MAG TPA: hypothetical protein VJZ26_08140 [Blastocatellia bacterium]|nr:hypothetical protein [Blastocatellia bacterium]